MNDILQTMKSNKTTSVERESYGLNEVLAIIVMLNEGLKVAQIAELTGRSVHSLRYKFCEGEVVLNGKKQIRSIRRFNSVEEIFAHYKTPYKGADDVAARIEEFKASLTKVEKAS